QVLREFDGCLTAFQRDALRGGSLSFSSHAFAEAFGQDVVHFFAAAASPGDPESCALLDSVLDGTSMLRKHFGHAPPGAERVVMEVVLVPPERRLQTFTVVEHLLNNVLRQQPHGGAAAKPVSGHNTNTTNDGDNGVLQLIRSAPHGDATIAALSRVVNETATNLLLNARQRAVIVNGLPLATPFPAHDAASVTSPRRNPAALYPPPPGLGGGGSSGDGGGGPLPHPGFSPFPNDHLCVPGRKRSHPPPRGGAPWGGAGPRGRGRGWGRGGRGGRGGGRI
ncbi:unnamed protein product, partial [Hapterophycus canaliculatus]